MALNKQRLAIKADLGTWKQEWDRVRGLQKEVFEFIKVTDQRAPFSYGPKELDKANKQFEVWGKWLFQFHIYLLDVNCCEDSGRTIDIVYSAILYGFNVLGIMNGSFTAEELKSTKAFAVARKDATVPTFVWAGTKKTDPLILEDAFEIGTKYRNSRHSFDYALRYLFQSVWDTSKGDKAQSMRNLWYLLKSSVKDADDIQDAGQLTNEILPWPNSEWADKTKDMTSQDYEILIPGTDDEEYSVPFQQAIVKGFQDAAALPLKEGAKFALKDLDFKDFKKLVDDAVSGQGVPAAGKAAIVTQKTPTSLIESTVPVLTPAPPQPPVKTPSLVRSGTQEALLPAKKQEPKEPQPTALPRRGSITGDDWNRIRNYRKELLGNIYGKNANEPVPVSVTATSKVKALDIALVPWQNWINTTFFPGLRNLKAVDVGNSVDVNLTMYMVGGELLVSLTRDIAAVTLDSTNFFQKLSAKDRSLLKAVFSSSRQGLLKPDSTRRLVFNPCLRYVFQLLYSSAAFQAPSATNRKMQMANLWYLLKKETMDIDAVNTSQDVTTMMTYWYNSYPRAMDELKYSLVNVDGSLKRAKDFSYQEDFLTLVEIGFEATQNPRKAGTGTGTAKGEKYSDRKALQDLSLADVSQLVTRASSAEKLYTVSPPVPAQTSPPKVPAPLPPKLPPSIAPLHSELERSKTALTQDKANLLGNFKEITRLVENLTDLAQKVQVRRDLFDYIKSHELSKSTVAEMKDKSFKLSQELKDVATRTEQEQADLNAQIADLSKQLQELTEQSKTVNQEEMNIRDLQLFLHTLQQYWTEVSVQYASLITEMDTMNKSVETNVLARIKLQ